MNGDSLRARYAWSRFKENHDGSPLWNAISPLIVDACSLGTWRIGNRETSCDVTCARYGRVAPSYIRRSPFRSIIDNTGNFGGFIELIPLEEHDRFSNVVLNDHPDSFVFKHSAVGLFSTKTYYSILVSQSIPQPLAWGKIIWKPWILPKISVLLWKFYSKVILTDESIIHMAIPLASKCSCCATPNVESAQHIFFDSDIAITIWQKPKHIFDRRRPKSSGLLRLLWLSCNKKNCIDCLAHGMAACALWELWKARNDLRFNNHKRDVWRHCHTWSSDICRLIKACPTDSARDNLIMKALRIQPPRSTPHLPWFILKPSDRELALDFASVVHESRVQACGLVRFICETTYLHQILCVVSRIKYRVD